MSEDHIVLLEGVRTMSRIKGTLYYCQGNFYYPFFSLHGADVGKVKRAIREFAKDNVELIRSDRAHPSYKTLPELCDAA